MRRFGVVLLVGVLALAGCGSSSPSASSSSSSSSGAGGSLDDVKITGSVGSKPTVSVPKSFGVSTSAGKIVIKGDGDTVTSGNKLTVDYVVIKGSDGSELETTFGNKPASLTLDKSTVIPVLVDKLVGATVGSRVVVAIAPADAYGAQGQASAGIGPNETLIFIIDIKSVRHPLAVASGTAVDPVPGLPVVTISPDGKPVIGVQSSDAPPTQLVHQPLIIGAGPTVTSGQSVSVHYTGVVWATGKQFDSSWDRGTPADFSIGVGKVITGWDESIVGATVGSRLLLVIPPDKGYGSAGNTSAGISGTDTLVFVVDILDAG